MTHAAKKPTTRPGKRDKSIDARDWVPVQYLITLYSKDLLQGIFNDHVDELSLGVIVNALRRVSHGPLVRFGMEGARARIRALTACVEGCVTGAVPDDCNDVYTHAYCFLFSCEEKDPELRLRTLKHHLKEKGIKVKATPPRNLGNDAPVNPMMGDQLQTFFDDKKLEVIIKVFDGLLRNARPIFKRIDAVDSLASVSYDTGLVDVSLETPMADTV